MGFTNGHDTSRYLTHLQDTTHGGTDADILVRTVHIDSHTTPDGGRISAAFETECILVATDGQGWVSHTRQGHILSSPTLMGAALDHQHLVRQAPRILAEARKRETRRRVAR